MNITSMLGAAAAIASTISFAPQAIKIIRTRDTSAISARMYLITVLGFSLWTAYGVRLGQWPLIAANTICLILSGFILVMKLLPPREKKAVADKLSP
jgi:MtN3 and saliva related transmembrane protein